MLYEPNKQDKEDVIINKITNEKREPANIVVIDELHSESREQTLSQKKRVILAYSKHQYFPHRVLI